MRVRNRRRQIGRRLNRAGRLAHIALTFPPDDERRTALLSVAAAELAELGIEVVPGGRRRSCTNTATGMSSETAECRNRASGRRTRRH
jgi:hypothetical protein